MTSPADSSLGKRMSMLSAACQVGQVWSANKRELCREMGVSENSVAINPLVLLIIIPMKNGYFIGNIPNIFRQTQIKSNKVVRVQEK